MNYVLDACAMIALVRDEPGGDVVLSILQQPEARCHAHAVNLCEVYYDFIRSDDERMANRIMSDLRRGGVISRRDMGAAFWRRVGHLKGTVRRVSIADCFAIELAHLLDARVVTSDHHEFDPLAAQGICRALFIR